MGRDKMQGNNLEKDEKTLIDKLRSARFDGQGNNAVLRDALGWDSARYWEVRNSLLDKGIVAKAVGGPGGKTVLVEAIDQKNKKAAAAEGKKVKPKYLREDSLYKPIAAQISENWVKEKGYDDYLVRVTAKLGRRNTGGKWSRPDVCLVGIHKFKFIREHVFDLVSFEVKTADAISVEGVFEALAHRQATNRAYVIYNASNQTFGKSEESDRIRALGERHGVGIILADNPEDHFSWDELVRAERWDPDPTYLNDFIEQVFAKEDHEKIIKMVR